MEPLDLTQSLADVVWLSSLTISLRVFHMHPRRKKEVPLMKTALVYDSSEPGHSKDCGTSSGDVYL